MASNPPRTFISYRRDDGAGHAGRLQESLERRLGRGSAFRDIGDIAPGEDFLPVIRARLADARGVLVPIGPRWAGGAPGGPRRIDDEGDFVRREVQEALASGVRVVPVLLPGTSMPTEEELPAPPKAPARRSALTLGDLHWDASVARLLAGLGQVPRRRIWPWAMGAAALGDWQAELRYDWGNRHSERFVFQRHAGALTGTASDLRLPRAIENLRFDGVNLHFETRTRVSSGSEERELTHAYAAVLRGRPPDQVLAFRLQSHGGFGGGHRPLEFQARRVDGPAAA